MSREGVGGLSLMVPLGQLVWVLGDRFLKTHFALRQLDCILGATVVLNGAADVRRMLHAAREGWRQRE
jgi:hypothetical protein